MNPRDGTALIVGNAGTVLFLDGERFMKITMPTFENLRAVAWNHDGSVALLAGNNGTLFKFSRGQVLRVDGKGESAGYIVAAKIRDRINLIQLLCRGIHPITQPLQLRG